MTDFSELPFETYSFDQATLRIGEDSFDIGTAVIERLDSMMYSISWSVSLPEVVSSTGITPVSLIADDYEIVLINSIIRSKSAIGTMIRKKQNAVIQSRSQ